MKFAADTSVSTEQSRAEIERIEEEFLAHIVLPNGETYGQFAIPQIADAYQSKRMPKLLSFGGG